MSDYTIERKPLSSAVTVRFPPRTLERIDDRLAEGKALSRSEVIRQLLVQALGEDQR
jgi:Arc/MetJ-type ribon-helix-helix transcriptional regulator